MNVDTGAKRLDHRLLARHMRNETEFDLRIVGRDQLLAFGGDEGRPDLPPLGGPDRDVLDVGVGRGQPSGRRTNHREGCVHAPGFGKDAFHQRVGIGRFQLRQLPPVEHLGGDFDAFGRERLENVGRGRIGASLGLLAAFQPHLLEQDLAKLLWRSDIELLAGKFDDLAVQHFHAGCEIVRHPGKDRRVDRDSRIFHRCQHRNQRTLQPLIDRAHTLGGKTRPEHLPQPQGDVGILGRIIQCRVRADRSEWNLLGTLAADILVFDRVMVEPVAGKIIHRMAADLAGIQHIGKAHRVVDRAKAHAPIVPAHQDVAVIFQIVADLQNRLILEQGFQDGDGVCEIDLLRALDLGLQRQPRLPVTFNGAAAMSKRHIAGAARRQRHRDSDKFGCRRVQGTRFRIDGQISLPPRLRHPGFQDGKVGDQPVVRLTRGNRWRRCCGRG